MSRWGGYLTLEDLKNYRAIEREPLTINYRGNTFLTNPPPSSGGILIAFALKLLSQVKLAEISFGSARHLQILAHVMRLTNKARKQGYNAYSHQEGIVQKFLAADFIDNYEQRLNNIVSKLGSTTHLSIIDSEGNAASVTTSHGEGLLM